MSQECSFGRAATTIVAKNQKFRTMCGEMLPAVSAVSSARIDMLSRSSAAHRARSRVNAATKASARSRVAHAQATAVACRARCLRLYHVEREIPSPATAVWRAVLARCRVPAASAPSASGLSRDVPGLSSLQFSESENPPYSTYAPQWGRRSSTSQEQRAGA